MKSFTEQKAKQLMRLSEIQSISLRRHKKRPMLPTSDPEQKIVTSSISHQGYFMQRRCKNLSILRVEKNGNYVVMNRTALNDQRLSWKAKGIIAYMLSMPDDWIFYINELTKHSTDGEKAFRSGLKELKENGYVKRKPVREGNKIVGWETIVTEVPQTLDNTLLADFVHVENVHVENVHVQKDALLSTEKELNTEKTKYIQFADTVRLTQEQYDRLVEEYGEKTVNDYIERLDEWQTNNPRKKKKDHNKTLRVWMKDVKKVEKPKQTAGALSGFWGDEF